MVFVAAHGSTQDSAHRRRRPGPSRGGCRAPADGGVRRPRGGHGVRQAREAKPDLILLDVDLPDMDGREACKRMRDDGVATPVIMLTAADTDDDTVRGLDSGANDYVTKPYKFEIGTA